MKRHIHTGFVAGMLLASGIAQATAQINEIEPNYPIGAAQKIDSNVAISAHLAPDDTDFYSVYALEGDVLTFDIDGTTNNLDTFISVFDVGAGYEILDSSDDESLDEGSVSTLDSRIENFRAPHSGYYVVGVVDANRYFANGGTPVNVSNATGDYKLIVSGATPQAARAQQINIEIKPGNDGLAPINPRSNGKIPVALLSSNGFDAMNVDVKSLRFGRTGNEGSLSHCGKSGEDVNGDGRLDLVCHFENQKAGFVKGDLTGYLSGKMTWGTSFEGHGFLKVIPEKRGS